MMADEPTRLLLDYDAARAALGGIGRTKLWDLVTQGEITRVNVGRRSFITAESLAAYVERISAAQPPTQSLAAIHLAPDPEGLVPSWVLGNPEEADITTNGPAMKAMRVRAGLTQADLASKMCGQGFQWDHTVVSRIESGKRELSASEFTVAVGEIAHHQGDDILHPGQIAKMFNIPIEQLHNDRRNYVGIPFQRHKGHITYLRSEATRYVEALNTPTPSPCRCTHPFAHHLLSSKGSGICSGQGTRCKCKSYNPSPESASATTTPVEEQIRRIVAEAPPLTPEQRDRIATILKGGRP